MLEHMINACLDVFSEVAAERHLPLSQQKSSETLFGHLTLDNRRPIFKFYSASVLVTETVTVTYLGFVLNMVRDKIQDLTVNIKKTS